MPVDLTGAQNTLRESSTILTESLNPKNILRKMKPRNALTSDEVTIINTETTDTDKVDKLVETLKRKPLTSYQVFMALLAEERPDLHQEVKKIEAKHVDNALNTSFSTMSTGSGGLATGSGTASALNNKKVDDRDILAVTYNVGLSRNQLLLLYKLLDLQSADVENAERTAGTLDFKLQAVKVLEHWLSKNGAAATRQAIIDALTECGDCKDAIEKLTAKWS